MLQNQKIFKTREFISILNRNGYIRIRTTGDHGVFSNGRRSIVITVKGKEINRMIARRLIKENNLIWLKTPKSATIHFFIRNIYSFGPVYIL